jgi:hypothetical protein
MAGRYDPIPDVRSGGYSVWGGSWSVSQARRHHGAGSEPLSRQVRSRAVEQRETHRRQAAHAAEPRLVDLDQAADQRQEARSRPFQPGDRQQAAWLRCRCRARRRRGAERRRHGSGDHPPEEYRRSGAIRVDRPDPASARRVPEADWTSPEKVEGFSDRFIESEERQWAR